MRPHFYAGLGLLAVRTVNKRAVLWEYNNIAVFESLTKAWNRTKIYSNIAMQMSTDNFQKSVHMIPEKTTDRS